MSLGAGGVSRGSEEAPELITPLRDGCHAHLREAGGRSRDSAKGQNWGFVATPSPGALRLLGKGASIPRPLGCSPCPVLVLGKALSILREQSPRSPGFLDSKHKRGPVAALSATADFESSSGLG